MRQPAPRVDGFRHKAYFRFCIKPTSDASQNTSRMPPNSVNVAAQYSVENILRDCQKA